MTHAQELDTYDAPPRTPAIRESRDQPANMLEIVQRAAIDPRVDVDKLERLMAMAERVKAQEAQASYGRALAKMQPTLPVIDRKGRITIYNKADADKPEHERRIVQSTSFARWEDIHDAITPVLSKAGFALSFKPDVASDGKIVITGLLRHKDGHQEEASITLPHDSSGSKNPVQAVGSTLSYGKRYAATMLLNLLTRDEDDDGQAGGAPADPEWITATEVANLNVLMDEAGVNRERFLDFLQVETLSRLPRSRHTEVLGLIAQKKRLRAQGGH